MNQKRRKAASTKNIITKNMNNVRLVCLALHLLGSINYLSEGALTQPTLSFTTAGSQSGKKQLKCLYNNIKSLYKYK